ncbi:MAG: hypothetical protein HC844_19870, partial [Tabrizicola sp.]|nr:hypothetical protein [Tabrizicola sp.]
MPVLLATTVQAETLAPVAGEGPGSPYLYAKSGGKAKRAAEAEAAGAKVIGGQVAADGAWPWQVALLVGGILALLVTLTRWQFIHCLQRIRSICADRARTQYARVLDHLFRDRDPVL